MFDPLALAFLSPIFAALGVGFLVIIRRMIRRAARRAGRKVREVVADAVENTPIVKQTATDVSTMRKQYDALAQRVFVLENRRPGGRRRTDPPPPTDPPRSGRRARGA